MKQRIKLDPSSLRLWACPRHFQLSNIFGYQSKLGSAPLAFGQGLHRAAAQFRRDKLDEKDVSDTAPYVAIATDYYAKQMCIKSFPRDMENLAAVVHDYCTFWLYADDFVPLRNAAGSAGIELPFSFDKWYEDEHIEVDLCGVIDAVGTEDGSRPIILDIKHSASKNITAHLADFKRQSQFMLYSWALKQIGWVDYYPPVRVDGVFIAKEYKGARCVRSDIIDIQDYQVERVLERVRDACIGISRMIAKGGEFPHDFSQCKMFYKACDFDPICTVQEQFQGMALKTGYTQRVYDPATFGED